MKQFGIGKTDLGLWLAVAAVVLCVVALSRSSRINSHHAITFSTEKEVILDKTTDLDSLIEIMKEDPEAVELNEEELRWAAGLLGWKRFSKGRYTFEGNYSYENILSKMARGIQDPVSVVLLPGITAERLAAGLAAEFEFTESEMMAALTDSSFLAEKNWSKEDLMGRMLPETYLMYYTSGPEDVRRKILAEFTRQVREPYSERAAELDRDLSEIITMASIVEWEAVDTDEKKTISGLYWNRLNRGMLLQADPTVNYAVGERRRLLFEDYKTEHPFNTYVNPGLPPAPVTNPSLSSIEAALYPEEHDYLYMVANPEGGHTFTRSFEAHKRESEKWRKWIREQYRIKREREREAELNTNKETR